MYRPTKPRPLDRPVSIVIRPPPRSSAAGIELVCCTNARSDPGAVSCGRRGAGELIRALRRGVRARGLDVAVVAGGCLGACNVGPNIRIAPSSSWMSGARARDLPAILDAVEGLIADHRRHARPDRAD